MKKKVFNITMCVLLVIMILTNAMLVMAKEDSKMTKLEELEELIDERFIEDVDTEYLEDAAAEAMIRAMGDRWSYYIPASEYQAYEEVMDNAYVGIGVTILQHERGGFLIQDVTAGGPAEDAGIQTGDRIVGIDGHDARKMDADQAKNLVRGDEGTKVALMILRGEEKLTIQVERRQIETVVAVGTMLEDGIGMVTIENFDTRCAEESIEAIEMLLDQGAEKIVFDVRNNPGGYAHELVALLDYLLPEGELFRTVDYQGSEEVDRSDADYLDVPMAVLVNGDSYSAAEFFAAALRDYDAAVIVGEKTCGKGYFQVAYQLSDGSAANISVGKYFTPKGVSLDGVGVTPDVVVEVNKITASYIRSGRLEPHEDPQLTAAIEALN